MKKNLFIIAAAVLSLGFTACDDVPAPYGIDDEVIDDDDASGPKTLPYSEAFSSSLGDFTNYTTSGSGAWTINYSTATATGYNNSTSTTTAGTYYIVSPEISLDGQTAAYISYDYILRYNRDQANQQVYITTSFDETNPTEGWTLLNGTHTEGSDWDTFTTAQVNIPSEYMGQTIRLAFRFNCDSSSSSTWEVKNFSIQAGQVDSGDDDTPSGETVDVISNGGFENWTNGTPDDWTSTTTASSATLSQSTDARTGAYSVLVGGNESSNRRLGSKEYTLKAGTYTLTCYVKGAGQVRPGYTPVTDGTVGSYSYGSYITTVADEWTEVTYSFTLTAQTTVNFVLMNPATSSYATASDKLVDDFSVTTSDGGIADGTDSGTDEPTTEGYFSESFGSDLGSFTTENVSMDDALSYVWSWGGANYGAKASAYVSGTNYASESYLISPTIDLSAAMGTTTLTFQQAANYFSSLSNFQSACSVVVREVGGSWTTLAYSGDPSGSNWTFVTSTADLSAYNGKQIQIGFRYTSTSSVAGTWEIKNLVVE